MAVTLIAAAGLQGIPAVALTAPSQPLGLMSTAAAVPQALGSAVIDYPGGFSASLPSRLKRAGVGVVIRYVGAAKWKSLTRREADALRAQGIDIAAVYETKANWMLAGRAAGVSAAKRARAAVIACGGPRKPFIYFACDVGTHRYSDVNACLRGAASVLGADHVGIYGSYYVCDKGLKSGYATKAWQTEAWSSGKWLPQAALYQKAHRSGGSLGIDYDSNIPRADDLGQWGYSGVGGSTWTAESTPATGTLRAVAAVGATRGWAVGDSGTVVRTSDAGATWTRVSTPSTATLRAVAFADASAGWAVGDSGTIVRTADGGSTWTTQSAPSTATLTSVAFADASNGWAVGEAGAVIRTANGGSTWSTQATPATGALEAVAFADASNGWAVGDGGTVIRTANGGATWARQATPATATLTSVAFADASNGWAVGEGGAVIRTTSGGATWARQATPTTATLTSVAFADASNGWAVGEGGAVIRTANGGATWTLATTPAAHTLASVAISDANTGWAVGEGGTVIRARKNGTDFFGTAAGVVTDAATGKPISGASVQVGSRPPVPTATDGTFVLARVLPGTYTVTVTSPVYVTCSMRGIVVSAGARVSVKMRPTPRAVTRLSTLALSSQVPTRGVAVSFATTLSPASAASSTASTLYLSHCEPKRVTKLIKGKRRRVTVWYWRQRYALRMAADASGRLTVRAALAAGMWRVSARCSGSWRYLPSVSATSRFSVR